MIVQTGDILDRGDEEEAIFRLLDDLDREARAAGGAVHVLNGNHELMNAYLDYRYVTDGGWADFEDVTTVAAVDSFLATLEPHQRARAQALRPGGEFARLLAERNTFLILGRDPVHARRSPSRARGLRAGVDERPGPRVAAG